MLSAGPPCFVGGHHEKSNFKVVTTICTLSDELVEDPFTDEHASLITFAADRPAHDWRYANNVGKIQRELGWTPEEHFETGLRTAVAWYLETGDRCERFLAGAYRLERIGLAGAVA